MCKKYSRLQAGRYQQYIAYNRQVRYILHKMSVNLSRFSCQGNMSFTRRNIYGRCLSREQQFFWLWRNVYQVKQKEETCLHRRMNFKIVVVKIPLGNICILRLDFWNSKCQAVMILLVLYYIHCTQMFDFDNFRPLLSPNVSFKVHSAQQYLRVKLTKN